MGSHQSTNAFAVVVRPSPSRAMGSHLLAHHFYMDNPYRGNSSLRSSIHPPMYSLFTRTIRIPSHPLQKVMMASRRRTDTNTTPSVRPPPPPPPTVTVTRLAREPVRKQGKLAGWQRYLSQPFTTRMEMCVCVSMHGCMGFYATALQPSSSRWRFRVFRAPRLDQVLDLPARTAVFPSELCYLLNPCGHTRSPRSWYVVQTAQLQANTTNHRSGLRPSAINSPARCLAIHGKNCHDGISAPSPRALRIIPTTIYN